MAELFSRIPVGGLSTGLITWYAPDRRAIALVTSWLALIGGDLPRVRMGWPGFRNELSRFWPGGDFVLHVLDDNRPSIFHERVRAGQVCLDIATDLADEVACAEQVAAPRLPACHVQFECRNGRIITDGFEPELLGDVVLVHHGRQVLPSREIAGLRRVNPLQSELSFAK